MGVEDDPSEIISSEGLSDVVVSTEVVEHLYSPHMLPLFAYKCLSPGGGGDRDNPLSWVSEKSCLELIG